MSETSDKRLRWVARLGACALFLLAGVGHFRNPTPFIKIVPPFLPHPEALVAISGVFEILGAIGLLMPGRLKRVAAWGLVALLVAVFPANIYMAVAHVQIGGFLDNPVVQWVRLPFQFLFIVWVLWATKEP